MSAGRKAVLNLYQPHEGQRQLHESDARFRSAACGRRWGKTFSGINELGKHAWEHPDSLTWWVSPVYRQARKPFFVTVRSFRDAIDSYKTAEEMSIVWKNGARSEFVSAEKYDNLRGEGVNLMVVDEAGFVSNAAWINALQPMLTQTLGRALFIGTPNGKGGSWFYEQWVFGLPENRAKYPEYESFHFPTASSPYISGNEIERLRSIYPADVFAQEYEADFLDDAAGVFRNVRHCIGGELRLPWPGCRYVMGVDLARKRDFTVLTVVDVETMQVVAWERFNVIAWAVQIPRIVSLAQRYGASVLLDTTGIGDPIVEQIRAAGVNVDEYMFNNRSKQQLIENLAVAIEHERIHFPKIDVLINELDSFRYEMTKTRQIRYSAPEGFHDDAVISLALAVWQAQRGSRGPVLLVWDADEIISPY